MKGPSSISSTCDNSLDETTSERSGRGLVWATTEDQEGVGDVGWIGITAGFVDGRAHCKCLFGNNAAEQSAGATVVEDSRW